MSRFKAAALSLAIVSIALQSCGKAPDPPPVPVEEEEIRVLNQGVLSSAVTEESALDNGYVIRVRGGGPTAGAFGTALEFSRNDQIELRMTESRAFDLLPVKKAYQDFTGDGVKDYVVEYFTGGAHCCYGYVLFGFGPVAQLGDADTQDSQAEIADVDGDGVYEFRCNDWTFAYWHTSFAESVAVPVVLQFRDGGFHLHAAAMQGPRDYSPEAWQRLVDEVRDSFAAAPSDSSAESVWGPIPRTLVETLLHLIYSGKSDKAAQLLQEAWPADRPGMDAFQESFTQQLKKSPYYEDLRALNK